MEREQRLTKKQNLMQAVKFLLFSISAGVVQAVSFTLLNELTGWPYWPSYLVALVLSVLYNFTVNRAFTFQSTVNVPAAMLKVLGYYAIFTPLSTWWGTALTDIGWNEYIVLGITMVLNFVTEFLFCRLVVYRGQINTNARGEKENERYRQQSAK